METETDEDWVWKEETDTTLENFIGVRRHIAITIGFIEAGILGELEAERKYWRKKNNLIDDMWFFSTVENMEAQTGIKRDVQSRVFKKLEKLGLIETRRFGLPARRYIRINSQKVKEVIKQGEDIMYGRMNPSGQEVSLEDLATHSCRESLELDVGNSDGNNKNNIIKINKENNIYSPSALPKVRTEKFSITLDGLVEMCEKYGYRGMNETARGMAEWFESVARKDDGGLCYKGRDIKDYKTLLFTLRAIDVNGKAFKSAKRKPADKAYKPRSDEGSLFLGG